MGGSGSTRRVVVEEVDGSGVVKISDSVVKRIRGDEDSPTDAGASKYNVKASREDEWSSKGMSCDGKQDAAGGDKPQASSTPPYDYAKRKVTVTERDVQGSGGSVEDIEAFYTQALRELEQRNSELQRITNEQFVKAVQEVEQKFLKHTCAPVCQENQSKVYGCYLDNPKQTLNCSAEVRAFSTCVERARQNALLRKS